MSDSFWSLFALAIQDDAALDSRPSPPFLGSGRDELRRPAAVGGIPASAAGSNIGAGARSWPRRATCDQLIQHPRVELLFNACVLPPAHAGTHLPAPRKGR